MLNFRQIWIALSAPCLSAPNPRTFLRSGRKSCKSNNKAPETRPADSYEIMRAPRKGLGISEATIEGKFSRDLQLQQSNAAPPSNKAVNVALQETNTLIQITQNLIAPNPLVCLPNLQRDFAMTQLHTSARLRFLHAQDSHII